MDGKRTLLAGLAGLALLAGLQTGVPWPTAWAKEEKAKPVAPSPIRVDAKARRIEIDARMGEPNRVLEYLLVQEEKGPAYESLLTTKCRVKALHAALLKIGLTKPLRADTGFGRGEPRQIHGEKVEIWAEWKNGSKTIRKRLEDLVHHVKPKVKLPFPASGWVFLPDIRHGERGAVRGVMHAGLEGNLISILHDPFSALTHPDSQEEDPDQQIFPSAAAPKAGTKIKLTFQPVREETLARNAMTREKDSVRKKALAAVVQWAVRVDRHRAAWKKQAAELAGMEARFDTIQNDKKRLKEAQALYQRIGQVRKRTRAARTNLTRDEQEIAATHLAAAVARQKAEKKPSSGLLTYLRKRQFIANRRLTLLRLLVLRDDADRDRGELEDKMEELLKAGKEKETEALAGKIEILSARAEIYDLKIQFIVDVESLEMAQAALEQAKRDIELYNERLANTAKELKELGSTPPDARRKKKKEED